MSKNSLYFLSAKRTAFGANGGALKDLSPTDLGVHAAQAALAQSGVSADQVDHVIFGNVLQSAPDSIYAARHIGLRCGVPISVPALAINRLCGSGFQVIIEAYHQMLAGDTRLALVGGVEAMSMTPYVLRGARFGLKMGHKQTEDMLTTSLFDSYAQAPMAITAENLALQYEISREQCDAFALSSQKKAHAALSAGFLTDEIAPMAMLAQDEHPRADATAEGLAKLKPLFKKDGVVTAGNASGIVDGGAALVVANEEIAKKHKPLGRLISYGVSGCDPKIMGIGPVPAARQALERAGMKISQMDLIEVNEAFAPQTLAVAKELEIPLDRLNLQGGAIAIGHPLAASGTRLTMTALYALRRMKKRHALVSACIGGGQGIALVLEAV
jgi:acetyl-CoA acyltransferase 2